MSEHNEVYEFEVVTRFRVAADNKHDAMQAALDVEGSINTTSCRAIYGGSATAIRCKAPTIRRFLKTKRLMPTEPVERDVIDSISRRSAMLSPLTYDWRITLSLAGKHYEYPVTAPTDKRAINKARTKLYHDTGHVGASLQSVKQED